MSERKKNRTSDSVLHALRTGCGVYSGDRILLGVSGGADSMVLLHMMVSLIPVMTISIGVAHLDHCLRGEDSENDCRLVQSVCEASGIPFYPGSENVAAHSEAHKLSLEEAARNLRYRFLFNTADAHGYTKVATAHHADDNAELVLMNLIRGSGASGLRGMEYQSRNGRLIRPFLSITRDEVMDYVDSYDISYRYDTTNSDKAFLRNRVRLELLPLLCGKYNPNIRDTLNRISDIHRHEEEWIASVIQPVFDDLVLQRDDKAITLGQKPFNRLHLAVRRRIVRKALQAVKGDLRRFSMEHTDAVCRLATGNGSRASLDLPGNIRVLRRDNCILFRKESGNLRDKSPYAMGDIVPYSYRVDGVTASGHEVVLEETGIKLKLSIVTQTESLPIESPEPATGMLDLDKVSFPLEIRNPLPGDRFSPLGMKGSQKLKKFFSNRHIPADDRKMCPLVISMGEIIWVGGHRISHRFRVTEETENILKLELLLA